LLSGRAVFIDQRCLRIVAVTFQLRRNVHADAERQKVDRRQVAQAVQSDPRRQQPEEKDHAPFDCRGVTVVLSERLFPSRAPQDDGKQQQDYVFEKGLPVGQFDEVAETAAVGHRVPQGEHESQQREESEQDRQQCRDALFPDTEQQAESQQHFRGGQQDRKGVFGSGQPTHSEGVEIFSELDGRAPRIDGFDKPRKNKYSCNDPSQQSGQESMFFHGVCDWLVDKCMFFNGDMQFYTLFPNFAERAGIAGRTKRKRMENRVDRILKRVVRFCRRAVDRRRGRFAPQCAKNH
jgi:hypothetical protein